jgi:hypothetical protein
LFNRRLGFHLDRGGVLVLLLPAALCLGPWAAGLALLAAVAGTVWTDRWLSPAEKQKIIEGTAEYAKRLGLRRTTRFQAGMKG